MRLLPICAALLALASCAEGGAGAIGDDPDARAGAGPDDSGFLYVWATAFDTVAGAGSSETRSRSRGVILVTVDLREGSPARGSVTRVTVADTTGRAAHHTEHALAPDGVLFANDFGSGRTHRFDLGAPGEPRLLGHFTTARPLGFPHSFVRLPGGSVLATYQWRHSRQPPGGLAELRRDGAALRWSSAAAPGVDSTQFHPYSLEVLPALDRVVTTSTSMVDDVGVHVQVWRLSDLALLHTLPIPEAPTHTGHSAEQAATPGHTGEHHLFPGEPRVLADGRTVMLGTFTCGLYRLTGLEEPEPRIEFSLAFPGENCAVPVRVGRWWVQTVPALRALVALDVSVSERPREVSRLVFEAPVVPHWLAADASGTRLVTNSGALDDPRLYLAVLDPRTGALAPDPSTPVVDLSRVAVPGLGVVRAAPHGSVFGPGSR